MSMASNPASGQHPSRQWSKLHCDVRSSVLTRFTKVRAPRLLELPLQFASDLNSRREQLLACKFREDCTVEQEVLFAVAVWWSTSCKVEPP